MIRFPLRSSIRVNITFNLLLGTGIFVLAISFLLDGTISGFLWRRFDAELLKRAQALVSLTEEDEAGVDFDFVGDFMPEFQTAEGPEFFEIWLPNDRLLGKSESLAHSEIPLSHTLIDAPDYQKISLPQVGSCRVMRLSFLPQWDVDDEDDNEDDSEARLEKKQKTSHEEQAGQDSVGAETVSEDTQGPPVYDAEEDEAETSGVEEEKENEQKQPLLKPSSQPERAVTLLLARKTADFDRLLLIIRWLIWGSSGLLVLLITLLVSFALKKGLEPLEEVRQQVRTIDPKALDTRIRLSNPVEELVPVVDQLNALLARLEDTVGRERRFTSDVAHELRTPLAELRSLSEVGPKDPDDREMVLSFFGDVRDISLEMQHLVSNLLELSRCDSGNRMAAMKQVDPAAIIDKTWKRTAVTAQHRQISLAKHLSQSLCVQSDQLLLEQILQNLLNNAVTYSPEHSVIAVECKEAAERLCLTISNPAPNLTADDLPRMFERFWQKDQARTGGKNSGLGLSLVTSFAALLGIEIRTSLTEGRLFFSLFFPPL